MILAVRVQPSQHGGGDEYVRLADSTWSCGGKMWATVGVRPGRASIR